MDSSQHAEGKRAPEFVHKLGLHRQLFGTEHLDICSLLQPTCLGRVPTWARQAVRRPRVDWSMPASLTCRTGRPAHRTGTYSRRSPS
eukprot:SAG25_NODE_331_length_9668_cov_3.863518_4_plen_87_part_00